MVDTPSVLVVRDGSAPPLTRSVGGTIDGSGTFYPEHSLRSDGVPVGAAAPLPVADPSMGVGATGIAQPTGGSGALGWLSGIYAALKGTLAVSATALPLPANGAQETGGNLATIASKVSGTLPVSQAPSALVNSSASTMGTAAAIIVPFSGTRKWLAISNRTLGVETHDIGSSNVVVGAGIPIAPGATFTFSGVGAAGPIYGITTVPGSAFSYVEG